MQTIKALLICGSGSNSSFLLSNINDAAARFNVDLELKEIWEIDFKKRIPKIDVIITTLQKKYLIKKNNYVAKHVLVISPEDLASLDGTSIVEKIIKLFKEDNEDGK